MTQQLYFNWVQINTTKWLITDRTQLHTMSSNQKLCKTDVCSQSWSWNHKKTYVCPKFLPTKKCFQRSVFKNYLNPFLWINNLIYLFCRIMSKSRNLQEYEMNIKWKHEWKWSSSQEMFLSLIKQVHFYLNTNKICYMNLGKVTNAQVQKAFHTFIDFKIF